MGIGVGSEADLPQAPRPLSERLARRLFPTVAGGSPSPEVLAVATADTYQRLHAVLAVFLGEQGFEALWRRAIHLARQAAPAGGDAASEEAPPLPPGLHSMLGGNPAEAHARLLAAFASFIALLFTFVGEELGSRLIAQAWPELPANAAAAHEEGASQ